VVTLRLVDTHCNQDRTRIRRQTTQQFPTCSSLSQSNVVNIIFTAAAFAECIVTRSTQPAAVACLWLYYEGTVKNGVVPLPTLRVHTCLQVSLPLVAVSHCQLSEKIVVESVVAAWVAKCLFVGLLRPRTIPEVNPVVLLDQQRKAAVSTAKTDVFAWPQLAFTLTPPGESSRLLRCGLALPSLQQLVVRRLGARCVLADTRRVCGCIARISQLEVAHIHVCLLLARLRLSVQGHTLCRELQRGCYRGNPLEKPRRTGTVYIRLRGHYERESRGDLQNHKMNANIVSRAYLQPKKLLTYVHAIMLIVELLEETERERENRIADCLALDKCMIWTLDFTETVVGKYKFSKI